MNPNENHMVNAHNLVESTVRKMEQIKVEPNNILPKRLDYNRFRANYGISFNDVANSTNIIEIVSNLIEATTTTPTYNYRNKLMSAYLMTPSALTQSCPILFCYGESGTGKSAVGIIGAELNGCNPLQGETSTFAAIRNEVNNNRFNASYYPPREENFCLVVDDITDKLFTQTNMLSIFKAGCYRKTDKISIASGDKPGENKSFHCYGLKIISSIHPIHHIEEYKELHRRLLPILFTKSSDAPTVEHTLIDFKDIDLLFDTFWQDESNCIEYSQLLKSINRRIKSISKKCNNLSVDRVALMSSICATAIYCNYFSNEIEFYQSVYDSWQDCTNASYKTGLDEIVESLLMQYTVIEDNAEYIDHDKFRFALAHAREKELTDIKMTTLKIHLQRRGYKLIDIDGKKIWELLK